MIKPVIIFFISAILFSANDQRDILCWHESYRLTFDDFKAVNIKFADISEHPTGLITKTILVTHEILKDTVIFDISACMDRNQSWLKINTDTATLVHEQGHFDITETYARILRREIRNINSIEEGKRLWEEISEMEEAKQNEFDLENSGIPEGVSSKWKKMIAINLNALEDYKNPIVKISLKQRTHKN